MGVSTLPETVTRQRRGCDLNPGPSAPECSTLATRLPCLEAHAQFTPPAKQCWCLRRVWRGGANWTIALNAFRLRKVFCRRQSWVVGESSSHRRCGRDVDKTVLSCLAPRCACEFSLGGNALCRVVCDRRTQRCTHECDQFLYFIWVVSLVRVKLFRVYICHLKFFCVVSFQCVRLSFFTAEPRDWARFTSTKWPMISCRAGRKTLNSVSQSTNWCLSDCMFKSVVFLDSCLARCCTSQRVMNHHRHRHFKTGLNSKNYCKDYCSGGDIMTRKRKCH